MARRLRQKSTRERREKPPNNKRLGRARRRGGNLAPVAAFGFCELRLEAERIFACLDTICDVSDEIITTLCFRVYAV
jgi:hypothetical protein